MSIIETSTLTEEQKRDIVELWNKEYPKGLALVDVTDFDLYLQALSNRHHLILCDENGRVKGWLIYFIRENEPCFAMILDSSLQGKGWGSRFLDRAKERNSVLIGWVIDNSDEPKQNGEPYLSPIGFYRKNGFTVRPDIQTKKKNINGIRVIWERK